MGKTTVAASLAVQQAICQPDKRILLASIDPAHSLLNLFVEYQQMQSGVGQILSGQLQIRELNLSGFIRDFQLQYGEMIASVAERGSMLNESDLQSFIQLSLPSIGDLMALLLLYEQLESDLFDVAVIDTAPTGHTLRLLVLPEFLEALVGTLRLLESKHEILVTSLLGQTSGYMREIQLERLSQQAERLSAHLVDPSWTSAFAVTLAEHLSVEETKRFVHSLHQRGLQAKGIIVNQIANPDCDFCSTRFAWQRAYLQDLFEHFRKELPIYCLPLMGVEPDEFDGLMELSASLREFNCTESLLQPPRHSMPNLNIQAPALLEDPLASGRHLLIFAGKGGVGKTSTCTASALYLASRHPDKKLLLVSIDPAHSLGDCLELTLGPEPKQICPNLWCLEIDATLLLGQFRAVYEQETLDMLASLLGKESESSGSALTLDRAIAQKLVELDSPDLDEFMVLRKLQNLLDDTSYDCLILDPAPAGHLLRFLQLPELANKWITAALNLIKEHHLIEGCRRSVRELLDLMKASKKFREQIRNPAHTSLVATTTARHLVMQGTGELLAQVSAAGIHCDTILVNMLRQDRLDCKACHSIYCREQAELQSFKHAYPDYKYVITELAKEEITGNDCLLSLGGMLYG